jgi:hypothetical protein
MRHLSPSKLVTVRTGGGFERFAGLGAPRRGVACDAAPRILSVVKARSHGRLAESAPWSGNRITDG